MSLEFTETTYSVDEDALSISTILELVGGIEPTEVDINGIVATADIEAVGMIRVVAIGCCLVEFATVTQLRCP